MLNHDERVAAYFSASLPKGTPLRQLTPQFCSPGHLVPYLLHCPAGEGAAFHSVTLSRSNEIYEAKLSVRTDYLSFQEKKRQISRPAWVKRELWQNSNAKKEYTEDGSRDGLQGGIYKHCLGMQGWCQETKSSAAILTCMSIITKRASAAKQ